MTFTFVLVPSGFEDPLGAGGGGGFFFAVPGLDEAETLLPPRAGLARTVGISSGTASRGGDGVLGFAGGRRSSSTTVQ